MNRTKGHCLAIREAGSYLLDKKTHQQLLNIFSKENSEKFNSLLMYDAHRLDEYFLLVNYDAVKMAVP